MKRLATIIRPHDAAGVVLGLGLGGLGGATRATRVIGGLAANALRRSPRANP